MVQCLFSIIGFGSHVKFGIGTKIIKSDEVHQISIPVKFLSVWLISFREDVKVCDMKEDRHWTIWFKMHEHEIAQCTINCPVI
jgi:hypothetical protein